MSRDAFERTVKRVATDPLTHRRGQTEEQVRSEVAVVAEKADQQAVAAPLTRDQIKARQDAVPAATTCIRARSKVDKDGELHYALDKSHGCHPVRLTLPRMANIESAGTFQRRLEDKMRKRLGG